MAGGSLLSELSDGDVVGELSMITGRPMTATVVTTMSTHLYAFHASTFRALVEDVPDVGFAMLRQLSEPVLRG